MPGMRKELRIRLSHSSRMTGKLAASTDSSGYSLKSRSKAGSLRKSPRCSARTKISATQSLMRLPAVTGFLLGRGRRNRGRRIRIAAQEGDQVDAVLFAAHAGKAHLGSGDVDTGRLDE